MKLSSPEAVEKTALTRLGKRLRVSHFPPARRRRLAVFFDFAAV
jgi:hypothetical protein